MSSVHRTGTPIKALVDTEATSVKSHFEKRSNCDLKPTNVHYNQLVRTMMVDGCNQLAINRRKSDLKETQALVNMKTQLLQSSTNVYDIQCYNLEIFALERYIAEEEASIVETETFAQHDYALEQLVTFDDASDRWKFVEAQRVMGSKLIRMDESETRITTNVMEWLKRKLQNNLSDAFSDGEKEGLAPKRRRTKPISSENGISHITSNNSHRRSQHFIESSNLQTIKNEIIDLSSSPCRDKEESIPQIKVVSKKRQRKIHDDDEYDGADVLNLENQVNVPPRLSDEGLTAADQSMQTQPISLAFQHADANDTWSMICNEIYSSFHPTSHQISSFVPLRENTAAVVSNAGSLEQDFWFDKNHSKSSTVLMEIGKITSKHEGVTLPNVDSVKAVNFYAKARQLLPSLKMKLRENSLNSLSKVMIRRKETMLNRENTLSFSSDTVTLSPGKEIELFVGDEISIEVTVKVKRSTTVEKFRYRLLAVGGAMDTSTYPGINKLSNKTNENPLKREEGELNRKGFITIEPKRLKLGQEGDTEEVMNEISDVSTAAGEALPFAASAAVTVDNNPQPIEEQSEDDNTGEYFRLGSSVRLMEEIVHELSLRYGSSGKSTGDDDKTTLENGTLLSTISAELLLEVDDEQQTLKHLSDKLYENARKFVSKDLKRHKDHSTIILSDGADMLRTLANLTAFCSSALFLDLLPRVFDGGTLKDVLEDSSLYSLLILCLWYPPSCILGQDSFANRTSKKVIEPTIGKDYPYLYHDMVPIVPKKNSVTRDNMNELAKNPIIQLNYFARLLCVLSLQSLINVTPTLYVGGDPSKRALNSSLRNEEKVHQRLNISLWNLNEFPDIRAVTAYHPSAPLHCSSVMTESRVQLALRIAMSANLNSTSSLSAMKTEKVIQSLIQRSLPPPPLQDETLWRFMHNRLDKSFKELGDVPTTDESLQEWITEQRQIEATTKLARERSEALTAIGFQWEPKTSSLLEERWDRQLESLQSHLANGGRFETASNFIHGWMSYQRKYFNENKLSERRKKVLESIQFPWVVDRNAPSRLYVQHRSKMLDLVAAYFKKHGHIEVEHADDPVLYHFLINTRYRKAHLPKDVIDELTTMGYNWQKKKSDLRLDKELETAKKIGLPENWRASITIVERRDRPGTTRQDVRIWDPRGNLHTDRTKVCELVGLRKLKIPKYSSTSKLGSNPIPDDDDDDDAVVWMGGNDKNAEYTKVIAANCVQYASSTRPEKGVISGNIMANFQFKKKDGNGTEKHDKKVRKKVQAALVWAYQNLTQALPPSDNPIPDDDDGAVDDYTKVIEENCAQYTASTRHEKAVIVDNIMANIQFNKEDDKKVRKKVQAALIKASKNLHPMGLAGCPDFDIFPPELGYGDNENVSIPLTSHVQSESTIPALRNEAVAFNYKWVPDVRDPVAFALKVELAVGVAKSDHPGLFDGSGGRRADFWKARFLELAAFKVRYLHCNVWANWEHNTALAEWVQRQHKKCDLGSERYMALKTLGFKSRKEDKEGEEEEGVKQGKKRK